MDAYHNLSFKNIFGNFWVSNFCEQVVDIKKTWLLCFVANIVFCLLVNTFFQGQWMALGKAI